MNQVDVVLGVLLVPFALRGYWRGLLREGFALFGIVGGVVAAATSWSELATIFVEHKLLSPVLAGGAAVTAIFVAVYAACQLVGWAADRVAHLVFLGGVNRVAGLAFGLLKGAAVLGFILLLVLRLVGSEEFQETVTQSTLGAPLVRLVTAFVVEASRRAAPGPTDKQPI
ncbi:MAG: CvpA family protein [Candidatus Binatia bacterium]